MKLDQRQELPTSFFGLAYDSKPLIKKFRINFVKKVENCQKKFLKRPQIFAILCCGRKPIFMLSGLVVKYQANLVELFPF